MPPLNPDVCADPVVLTRALVDVPSVSGDEAEIAALVEGALLGAGHLSVSRDGNTIMARTDLGRDHRIVLAGHLDTVPIADNLPSRIEGGRMYGCGTSDMKSGTALALWFALNHAAPRYDVTYFFYDCEEIEAERNGLGRVARARPEWLAADLAVLLEPSDARVEAGCQGTVRALVRTTGVRAHSARSWLGDNAIHAAGQALARLAAYQPRRVVLDGCEYREGLNAVRIAGGVAGNVIPDRCEVEVNYRYAPDLTLPAAVDHIREVFAGYEVEITDSAPAAPPGLTAPLAREFLAAVGSAPVAKYGWTDVSRFAALGIPALNFGPGDPNLAHTRGEYVEIAKIERGAEVLRAWLAG